MLRLTAAVFAAALLVGCDSSPFQSRYQLVTASEGKLYRLDTKTGALHYVTPERIYVITEEVALPVLRKGQFYQMEDGPEEAKYLKYVGNGQFEKSKIAKTASGATVSGW